MIHAGGLRETENASVGLNINKLSSLEKKPKMKTKALGDVQNTLHSRFGNFENANIGSGVKIPSKPFYSKSVAIENFPSCKSTESGRKVNVTPTKSARKIPVPTPDVDNEIFELHNHILCEQDHQFYVNDFLKEYRFSEEQINHLANSVKSFVTPFSVELFEPCEDIEILDVKKLSENRFSINDIFSDVVTPIVPPPAEVL